MLLDVSLGLHITVDAIVRGETTLQLLDDWTDNVLTFSKVAELRQTCGPQMARQLELATTVTRRFMTEDHVQLTPAEIELARAGLITAELLARGCGHTAAEAAARWSTQMREHINQARAAA
jgi:hypothetical protein